ncbi:hypothetical protein C5S31_06245, partial [ANME-1 cluster archaeon GoMg2]|nr:hypothetical protein [ANME-1 cluster archaeon GoMg2]
KKVYQQTFRKSLTKNASRLRRKETLCFFGKAFFLRKVCAKRKTKITFLVKVFTEYKKVVGKAFLSAKRFD